MDKQLNTLQAHLKQHGQSVTAARLTVFRALLDQEPQTMQQIVEGCPDIDRASVYRTTTLFEKLGIIERLQIGWKYKLELSDAFHHHHHHMSCKNCDRTIEISEDPQLEAYLIKLAKGRHFTMQSHQLEISGLCMNCQKS